MRDILEELLTYWRAGRAVGVATVVATGDSAPRQPGAMMLVGDDGQAAGSVSGGCVEGVVYGLAQEVARTGVPVLEQFGYTDDEAFGVGLSCGGTVDIYVERIAPSTFPELGDVAATIAAGEPVAVVTCVDGQGSRGERVVVWPQRTSGTLGEERLDAVVVADARAMLASGQPGLRRYGPRGERRGDELAVFVATYAPPPRMIIFGAMDFAADLAQVGSFLGYRVTVCDARPVFATAERFPFAHDVVVSWPHTYLAAEASRLDERSVVCVLTHEKRFDVPVLEVALRLPLAYVCAMGSRKTHQARLDELRAAGLTVAELERLASPAGLDLGARTGPETAISIAAELIATRWKGSGARLRAVTGPIHQVHAQPA